MHFDTPAVCPYVGLGPFEAAHAAYFFGRDRDSMVIADHVRSRSITVLYGASGAGKTSILNVGVPAELSKHRNWMIAHLRGWQDPSEIERQAVEAVLRNLATPPRKSARWSRFAPVVTWAVRSTGRPLLLILDEFENYFFSRNRFSMDNLELAIGDLVTRHDLPLHLLISLRDDALHRLDELRGVLPGILDTTVKLDHLSDTDIKDAIRKPVNAYNKRYRVGEVKFFVEDELISTLIQQLKEVGDGVNRGRSANTDRKRVELPYLQLALTKLWVAEREQNFEGMRAKTLTDSLGGVTEIVRNHVWKAIGRLDKHQQTICVHIFDRLVTSIGSKIVYPTNALVADEARLGVSREEVEGVLRELERPEARIVKQFEIGKGKLCELMHDVLGPPMLEWLQAQPAYQLKPKDSISTTHLLEVPAIHTYPKYRIPPAQDDRAEIRFGCAPLVDCCFPLFMQRLDPHTWNALARSHAIDVRISIVDFNKLFDEVDSPASDSGVDIVVASAAFVVRARSAYNTPVAVLPILQQFNAYYIFAKRTELVAYLERRGSNWAAKQCATMPPTSTIDAMLDKQSDKKEILRDILQNFRFHVERGADLEAALALYWTCLGGEASEISTKSTKPESIKTSFESFISADEPSLFMGGLAQTAFLSRRSDVGGDYVIFASPRDIDYRNVNSLVCSKELARDRPTDVFRFVGWWFDVLNWFRRSILFEETRDLELYTRAIQLMRDLPTENGIISLVPARAEDEDIEGMLDFLRITSAKESGSFMLPNIYDALKVETALTDNLRDLDAVVHLIQSESVTAVEKRPQMSGGAASDGA